MRRRLRPQPRNSRSSTRSSRARRPEPTAWIIPPARICSIRREGFASTRALAGVRTPSCTTSASCSNPPARRRASGWNARARVAIMEMTVQEAFALAARHEAAGRGDQARALYDQILAALPEHPGALLRIALLDLAEGRHDAARERLQRAIGAARAQALPQQEIWLGLARAELARGERERANAALDQVHGIAAQLKAAGAAAAARELLEQCVALAPEAAA